jgi:hypothetical protein
MNPHQNIDIELTTDQWRDVYRILNADRTKPAEGVAPKGREPKVNPVWQSHLQAIEDVCKAQQNLLTLPLAQTWPMSATVRQSNPELAEEISRQMNAQLQPVW